MFSVGSNVTLSGLNWSRVEGETSVGSNVRSVLFWLGFIQESHHLANATEDMAETNDASPSGSGLSSDRGWTAFFYQH